MTISNQVRIAFIGFGEVGQTFSKGLLASGKTTISAYDLKFDLEPNGACAAAPAALGVTRAASPDAAAKGADVVISAVTASEVEAVASVAARYMKPGQIFLDVNSAAPFTKQRAADMIGTTGAHYVEGAVMAPVLAPGIKVQILAGGPKSAEASDLLNSLGMNLTAVSDTYGRASAMKLCRSIIIKGLEALMVDCAAASKAFGVTDDVFASLAKSFPSIDWHALSENMQERVATHGVRRSAEMYEAAEMVDSIGLNPALISAVADAQLRGARRKPE